MPASEITMTRSTDSVSVPDPRGEVDADEIEDDPHIVRGTD